MNSAASRSQRRLRQVLCLACVKRAAKALAWWGGRVAVVFGIVAGATSPGVALFPNLATAVASPLPNQTGPRQVSPGDVMALQMFGPERGVAVTGGQSRKREYLAETTDGGANWVVTGRVPSDVSPPTPIGLQMAFVSLHRGYVRGVGPTGSAAIEFTSDAGGSWHRLEAPGTTSGLSVMGGLLWTVDQTCRRKADRSSCVPELATFSLGSTRPSSEQRLPSLSVPSSLGLDNIGGQAMLLDRLSRSAGVFAEGTPGGPTTLIETLDNGHHWERLRNPCRGLALTSLISVTERSWYLYCTRDEGVNQGRVALYKSMDDGRKWQAVARGSERSAGTIGDGIAYDLTASGNGRILWLVDVVGGLEMSADGGRKWSRCAVSTGGTGAVLATTGRTEAWLPAPFLGLYRTRNGKVWTRLR